MLRDDEVIGMLTIADDKDIFGTFREWLWQALSLR